MSRRSYYQHIETASEKMSAPVFVQGLASAATGLSLALTIDAAIPIISDIRNTVLPSVPELAYIIPATVALFCAVDLTLVKRAGNRETISSLNSGEHYNRRYDERTRTKSRAHLRHMTTLNFIAGAALAIFGLSILRASSISIMLPAGAACAASIGFSERSQNGLFEELGKFRSPIL